MKNATLFLIFLGNLYDGVEKSSFGLATQIDFHVGSQIFCQLTTFAEYNQQLVIGFNLRVLPQLLLSKIRP